MQTWRHLLPFPDVLSNLPRLAERYKLVALSNGNRRFFDACSCGFLSTLSSETRWTHLRVERLSCSNSAMAMSLLSRYWI